MPLSIYEQIIAILGDPSSKVESYIAYGCGAVLLILLIYALLKIPDWITRL